MSNKAFALAIIGIVALFCLIGGSMWFDQTSVRENEFDIEGKWVLSDVQLLSASNYSIECPFIIGDNFELHPNSTFEDANDLSGMWCSNGKWLSLTYFENGWNAEVTEILSLTKDKLRLRIGVGDELVQFWLLTYDRAD